MPALPPQGPLEARQGGVVPYLSAAVRSINFIEKEPFAVMIRNLLIHYGQLSNPSDWDAVKVVIKNMLEGQSGVIR